MEDIGGERCVEDGERMRDKRGGCLVGIVEMQRKHRLVVSEGWKSKR